MPDVSLSANKNYFFPNGKSTFSPSCDLKLIYSWLVFLPVQRSSVPVQFFFAFFYCNIDNAHMVANCKQRWKRAYRSLKHAIFFQGDNFLHGFISEDTLCWLYLLYISYI
ncbi:hypothetical protein VPH35_059846 [Triticum aestivum]|uniref:Uncharacterized protein n=1 Tax=Aegilops tauschii subsp. strangulata TaxID=200361 RepID=A0A453EY97_AEGTS